MMHGQKNIKLYTQLDSSLLPIIIIAYTQRFWHGQLHC
jgi:hypothetical protein